MDKQRKWQLFLILAVIALTIYNILPTVFYYCKPLKDPIGPSQGIEIAHSISQRVNALEKETENWLSSFCDLIQTKPLSIAVDSENPQFATVRFAKTEEAARFRTYLPRAGSLIPFTPAQLGLAAQEEAGKEVVVQRRIPLHFEEDLFSFASKSDPLYREVMLDRAMQIALALGGPTETAFTLSMVQQNPQPAYLEYLASQINTFAELFETNEKAAARFAATLTQGQFANRGESVSHLIAAFDAQRDGIKKQKTEAVDEDQVRLLEKKEMGLVRAGNFLKKHKTHFAAGQDPWDLPQIQAAFKTTLNDSPLSLGQRNPLFSELQIDWTNGEIILKLHPDVESLRNKDAFEQLLINEAAKVTRFTGESLVSGKGLFTIALHKIPETSSLLVLDLEKISALQANQIVHSIRSNWNPKHPDLQSLQVVDYATFQTLPPQDQALSLVVYAPSSEIGKSLPQFRNNSLYVIAKGIDQIAQNYEEHADSEQARLFGSDFTKLAQLLKQNGFNAYRQGNDFVFERNDFYRPLLAATREDFAVRGTQKYAFLEFANVEQRLVAANKIDTQIHEDLIKWKDEYYSAQISLNPAMRFDVPKPTKSVFWSNVGLSLRKLFRGDERKIIRWGLDLSGGKTVQIELRDANNSVVANEADLKQGINELYNRVNKMGVSEVSIRQVGNNIVLDFPGSQSLSAAELIKASSMYFHVVNEKFSIGNGELADTVNRFLQEVWNEAVVTHRKDVQSINAIAWKHLYGDSTDTSKPQPLTDAGRTLFENGLRLGSPNEPTFSHTVNDAVSKIAVLRGSDFTEWHGQSHPLMIVFRNFALEGSELDNIRSSYDPSKGNFLSFDVKGGAPQKNLHAWTSRFSKEKILGTPNEAYSKGRGWRMAVLLNDTIISAPTLDSALRDSAMISGSFSQREVSQLASDLKAGSLTFTPHILSEKNVSPELGQSDRIQGITATLFALVLVIGAMILYYRFAGFIASVAVLFNLLIMWATLQNLGATLTLAGLAAVILNIGMAVDANVLVFERIKEEFAATGRIASAISAGYSKAYSAIIDSNVTTIIAGLILLNFDAGPIKAFAVTLIIGIISSMFTALFMTRFYFSGWVQNPKNKALTMSNWIRAKKIDFLKQAKLAFSIAAVIVVGGGYLLYAERATIFGMDFTGGYSLNLELAADGTRSYISDVEKALVQNGAGSHDFQIRELNPSNQLRVLFGTSMELPGKPFAGMALEEEALNPRIEWVTGSLKSSGLEVAKASNWTAMSGQMSDSMRNNAAIGLLLSFVAIFIYVAFRFEYKFAAAAILCLMHDVLITLGLMGVLHALGVPVQIDLNTVAALMTIVGYSLNDTIIIFDRIREDSGLKTRRSLPEVVNASLNATLSRTMITSGTTLLVLIALVVLGGASIFSFATVMTIGVFFGTLSSWYIASPLMLFFHGREEKQWVQEA